MEEHKEYVEDHRDTAFYWGVVERYISGAREKVVEKLSRYKIFTEVDSEVGVVKNGGCLKKAPNSTIRNII